jgi:hypothetical protein
MKNSWKLSDILSISTNVLYSVVIPQRLRKFDCFSWTEQESLILSLGI